MSRLGQASGFGEFTEPAGDEVAFCSIADEVERFAIGGNGLIVPVEFAQQFGPRDGQRVVVAQLRFGAEAVEQGETGLRTVAHGNGDRPTESHDRGSGSGQQQIVEGNDLRPIGAVDVSGFDVQRSDGCLDGVRPRITTESLDQEVPALDDQAGVPAASILLRQGDGPPGRVDAGRSTRVGQQQ